MVEFVTQMPGWLVLAILVMGAYRVTRIITTDEVFAPVRNRLAETWDSSLGWVSRDRDTGEIYAVPQWRAFLREMLDCDWCAGFWVSVVTAAGLFIDPEWSTIVMVPFAISSAIGLIGGR